MEDLTARSVAVVCVHGVASHPRYEFQDQVSALLCDHLNESCGTPDAWVVDVVNPGNVLHHGGEEPLPTISRVHRRDDKDPRSPESSSFDVIEAYWSPISKGGTNWLWVVNWILKVVFVPLNTTASYDATWQKQFFDYGYIGGALALAFALFLISLGAVWQSFVRVLTVTGLIKNTNANDIINTLNTTANVPGFVPIKIGIWLFVGIIGGFLIGQALSAIWKLFVQRRALRHNPKAIWHRVVAIVVLVALGGACISAMAFAKFPNGVLGWQGVLFLIVIFVAFQLGYALLIGFMVGFFGDVQIYTTRDENDSRFYGMRDRILDVTVEAMMRAISPQLNGGRRYDRVIILAHSLGATIAMDALTRLYQLSLQGAVTREEFDRIRAFVTAGSSLEKTRYFFDVSGATPTASFEHWRNDAYGSIFTCNPRVLDRPNGHGVFWANYWYFQDPLCNEIRSYRADASDATPGHAICWNERGHKHMTLTHWLLHSDYLNDPWFWQSSERSAQTHLGILDIITSHVEGVCD